MYALVTSKSLSGIFWKWKHCFAGGRITSSSLSKSKAQEEYGDLEEERNEQTNKNLLLIGFYIFILSCTYWIEYPIGKLYYSVALCWLMWTYVHEKTGMNQPAHLPGSTRPAWSGHARRWSQRWLCDAEKLGWERYCGGFCGLYVWWILVRLGDYHIYWGRYEWIYTLKWLMISPLSTSILLKRAKVAKIHSGKNLRLTSFGLKFQPESIRAVFSACRSCRYRSI